MDCRSRKHCDTSKHFCAFSDNIDSFSTAYSCEYPELFVPYYFKYNFNVLQIIAEQYELDLPPVPSKNDYKDRFFYYGKICEALTQFRINYGLSPFELCAFLYDFAPQYIGGMSSYLIKELPDPKGAFLIGADENDSFLSNDSSAVTVWQCNENTRAGDLILMYIRTPISAIGSVWRACSIGFVDPFFYYYRCTYIRNMQRISPVTLKQLKADAVTSKIPVVRKNMQGVNGVELLPSEYNYLMDMASAETFRFEAEIIDEKDSIRRERDVEDKLIKPLMKKLGYRENDCTQQLYLEIGNHNHALIPDFVLLPQYYAGHTSAFAVLEAKKTISNQTQLEEAKNRREATQNC